MSLRAISFVRRKAALRAGHVGWAFEYRSGLFNCGSVENDQGHPIAPVAQMDFWTCNTLDPLAHMRERRYDAFQVVEVESPHPHDAWQAVVWLSRQPYFVLGRNCLDDVYDVMRAYGVPDLPMPAHEILPDRWFDLLPGDPQNLDEVEALPAHGWALLRERLPFNRDEQCDIPETENEKPPPWRIEGTPHHTEFRQRLETTHHGTPAKTEPPEKATR